MQPATTIVDYDTRERGELPFTATWVIDAPWAHPIWHQYLVVTFSLAPAQEGHEPTIYRPGMTHEMHVWAVDPDTPVTVWKERPEGCLLQPMNHGYQFKADSDDAALARVTALVQSLVEGTLSPDTDWRAMWDQLFADGVSLRINRLEAETQGATLQ